MKSTALELAFVLPGVDDARDACVARLTALLPAERGISHVHLVEEIPGEPRLCLHYDPEMLTLAQVERLAMSAGAKLLDQFGHTILPVRAITGEDAGRRIERSLMAAEGVLEASANLPAQRVRIEFDRTRTNLEQIAQLLKTLELNEAPTRGRAIDGWYLRNKELAWSIAAGLLLAVAWMAETWARLPRLVTIAIYLTSYAFGGYDLVRHAIGSFRKGRITLDIDLLMLLAAAGAAAIGEWAEGSLLLFLFSLAHALEHMALDRARNAIRALTDLSPPIARVARDGREVEIPIEQVLRGEIVLVRPAERIPVDGSVKSGASSVNQAPITGESVPVEKTVGSEVFAGTVNGEGALQIETKNAVGDRTLDRVIQLVEEAQTQKAPTQRFTDRFEAIFVPTVLVADLLLIVIPPLFAGWSWSMSFYRAMALLVAASPCALALGTPSTVLAAIARAARRGVLIKGGAHLEAFGTLRALALDKTGTLTEGKPEVTDVLPAPGVESSELLRLAAAVERESQHPLARAVARHAKKTGTPVAQAGELQSVIGKGIRSSVDGISAELGSPRLWESSGVEIPTAIRAAITDLQSRGRTIILTRHGERWLGALGVADRPRPGVQEILNRLRQLGLRPLIMLTGDNRAVGENIGREVGVDEVRADLMPEDKVGAIKELLAAHKFVGMVGDGVNDAPALATATVGIAMGGAGTAAALETADVALMGDDLAMLPFAVGLSRQARRIISQNLVVSLGVIALLILATTTGFMGIGPAVIVHEGSTFVVVGNALRLLRYGDDPS